MPTSFKRSQRPSRSDCTACGMLRASESIKPKVCSVAEIVFAAGVLSTTTPAVGGGGNVDRIDADAGARDDG